MPLRTVAARIEHMRDLTDEVKLGRRGVQGRNGGGRASDGAQPEVIKMLEDALDQARRAEIIAAAIVFARPNEDKCSGVSAPPRGPALSRRRMRLPQTRHHRGDGQLTGLGRARPRALWVGQMDSAHRRQLKIKEADPNKSVVGVFLPFPR